MPDTPHPDGRKLTDEITALATDDAKLSNEAREVLLATLEGDAALDEILGYDATAESAFAATPPSEPRTASTEPDRSASVRAFLTSISAEGFRGIGPECKLELNPRPGLTIVCGRNGSGKSSFAEALELALTGNTYRWDRNKVWTRNWRNLHHDEPCQIRIGIAEEGQGATEIGVDWKPGAELHDRSIWVQRPGQQRQAGTASLGWDRALERYRPLLSYEELGGLLEAPPKELFDKVYALLGMEQGTDAVDRLATRLKTLQEPEKSAKSAAQQLKTALGSVDDERARRTLTEMAEKVPDLDKLAAIATSREPGPEPGGLRATANLASPAREDIADAAGTLREAAAEYSAVRTDSADAAARRARLLQEALEHHRQAGDGDCPVCGEGHLDAAWHERVERELYTAQADLERLNQAKSTLAQASRHARELAAAVPRPLDIGEFDIEAYPLFEAAWQTWSNLPEGHTALAEHMEARYGELHEALTLLRAEAAEALRRHEDTWTPYAEQLAAWIGFAREARRKEQVVREVTAARKFLKEALERLRAERLARLADSAREVWAALKQESNVDLGAIELAGTANYRREVVLRADVDGAQAGALGVMSQGELHALALALFLPRATFPESPFQFVVLDDPIQAMDPAKVDAFVQVLQRIAADRQVVVFSHDDRLPQAVRNLNIDARILQVVRDTDSGVSISSCSDTATRALEDARALCNDPDVPSDVRNRVVPGLCRDAVEATAYDRYLTACFRDGVRREDVETTWASAAKTRPRLALALHGDRERDVTPWSDQRPWRKAALQVVGPDVHRPPNWDAATAKDAVRNVQRLVEDVRRDGAR